MMHFLSKSNDSLKNLPSVVRRLAGSQFPGVERRETTWEKR
jgi:hypothetical protein